MKIDLHSHSTASDGSLSPSQLVHHASERKLDLIALTDHDTVSGLLEFNTAGVRFGVQTLNGTELSVDVEDHTLHLLGYGFDPENPTLISVLPELRTSRHNRNIKILEKLTQLGYPLDPDRVALRARNGVLGRPHIAAELVASAGLTSIHEAFEKLLTRGGPAYFDRERLTLGKACAIIHAAGGAAIWAHPGVHGDELPSMLEMLPDWQKEGLDGLESDYPTHSPALRNNLQERAGRLGMIFTGGSDFHGSYRPNIDLGQGVEKLSIPDECYYQLRERIDAYQALLSK